MKITREDWNGVNIPAPEVADWVRDQANTPTSEMAKYPNSETFVTITRSGNTLVMRDTVKFSDGTEITRIYEAKVQACYTVKKE